MSGESVKVKNIARYIWRFVTASLSWQPLTLRGIAAHRIAALALEPPAFSERDLAAIQVGVATAGAIAAFALVALLLRIRLQRTVTARCRFDEVHAYSSASVPGGVVLDKCPILSFYELDVVRRFTKPGVISPHHIVKGSDRPARRRYLIDAVRFPHRGLWSLDSLNLSLSDIAGMVRLSWRLPVQSSIEVAAPTIPIRPLPILVSSARAGDELSFSQERSGDPFDMKAYDPSDGVKRIMWKVYARSQQLVVRRPEPAVIPEGELALYLVAGRNEDYVAGALQGYLEQLEDEQITVIFGTDGLAGKSESSGTENRTKQRQIAISSGPQYCTGMSEIRRAIIHSVWSETVGTGSGFAGYLNSLTAANKPMQRVVVFGPSRPDWLDRVAAGLRQGGTSVTAVIVPDEFRRVFGSGTAGIKAWPAIFPRVQPSDVREFYRRITEGSKHKPRASIDAVAARAGIELLRCERR